MKGRFLELITEHRGFRIYGRWLESESSQWDYVSDQEFLMIWLGRLFVRTDWWRR